MKRKTVTFNADDFGRDKSSTNACRDAFTRGMLSSVSLISITKDFKRAAAIAKALSIPTGAHVVIAIEEAIKKIYGGNRRFPLPCVAKDVLNTVDPELIYLECCDQIDAVLSAGLTITHIDFHKNAMTTVGTIGDDILKRLYSKYKTPIIVPSFHNTSGGYKIIRYRRRMGGGNRFRSKYIGFVRMIKRMQADVESFHWVPVHLSLDRVNEKWRVCEYEAMMSVDLKNIVKSSGIAIVPKKKIA
jgi:predicted glycoside hydrolase/deacetylase ChbG (UPF0249 family)